MTWPREPRTKEQDQKRLDDAVTEIKRDIERIDASLTMLMHSNYDIHEFAIDCMLQIRKELVSDLEMAEKRAKFGPWDWNRTKADLMISDPCEFVPLANNEHQVIINGKSYRFKVQK